MTRREKLSHLKSLSDNAAKRVQRSKTDWREFLRFYAKLYKYPFPEALLIYEQAPQATACGEIKHWNMVGRRVHRGTRGIPIINDTDRDMEIRYVFDVADTYGEDRGIPRRWSMPDRYMDAVVNELQSRFRVTPPTENQSKNLKWAVEEYVRESCEDFLDTLRQNVGESSLEGLDDDDLRERFSDTVVDSVGCLVSERLGLAQGLYGDDNLSFKFLRGFNTKAALYQIGAAAGHISRNVLTLISQTIQKQQQNERVKNYDEQRQIYDRGIESGAGDDRGGNRGGGERAEGAAAADGQVRQPVLGLSERESSVAARVPAGGDDAAGRVPAGGQRGAGDDGDGAEPAPRQDAGVGDRGLHSDGAIQHNDTGSG